MCGPRWGHTGSWSSSPCRGSSPSSTQMFAEVPPQQDQIFPGPPQHSNSRAWLCQLVLFPREKLLFLVNGVAFTSPCSTAPALCPCGRQHKGALWEARPGQELAQHSSHCSSRALAKDKGQNMFSFDRKKQFCL